MRKPFSICIVRGYHLDQMEKQAGDIRLLVLVVLVSYCYHHLHGPEDMLAGY